MPPPPPSAATLRRHPRRGAGALEFAIALPILLGFVLAIIDLGRFVLDLHRITAAAAAAADLGSQVEQFTSGMDPDAVVTGKEIAVLALAARETAAPMDLLANGAVIVTTIANVNGTTSVVWARRWGRANITSRVSAARLGGITLTPGDAALYAEVAYSFRPFILSGRLLGLNQSGDLLVTAVRRPRLSGPAITP